MLMHKSNSYEKAIMLRDEYVSLQMSEATGWMTSKVIDRLAVRNLKATLH